MYGGAGGGTDSIVQPMQPMVPMVYGYPPAPMAMMQPTPPPHAAGYSQGGGLVNGPVGMYPYYSYMEDAHHNHQQQKHKGTPPLTRRQRDGSTSSLDRAVRAGKSGAGSGSRKQKNKGAHKNLSMSMESLVSKDGTESLKDTGSPPVTRKNLRSEKSNSSLNGALSASTTSLDRQSFTKQPSMATEDLRKMLQDSNFGEEIPDDRSKLIKYVKRALWLKSQRLHKYNSILINKNEDWVQAANETTLTGLGMAQGAANKFLQKKSDVLKVWTTEPTPDELENKVAPTE